MPAGTDNQAFCYDEQDRLTWASSATATPPCGGSNTAGTLTGAQYTQSFAYDSMGRLTSGPVGTYTYGNSADLHAVTAIGSTYTASYDAAGEMTCRAPTSASTCAGSSPTGAQLGYDDEGRLLSWQAQPSSPTATDAFLYDGQGQRVVQKATQSGTTTTTVYVGGIEQVSTTGGATTTTAFYYAGGVRIGLAVNGTISYLASDGLGSAVVVLNGSGSPSASVLYTPYGTVRYTNGTMPTDYGFTGQHSDGLSGLDYYSARYYDPVAGQFVTGDSMLPGGGFDLWGLSRYAYVEGNPVGRTDPTGHEELDPGSGGGCDPSFCGGSDPGVLNPAPPPPADPVFGFTCGCAGTPAVTPPPPADPVVGFTCGCPPAPTAPPAAPDNPPPPDTPAAGTSQNGQTSSPNPVATQFSMPMIGIGHPCRDEKCRADLAAGQSSADQFWQQVGSGLWDHTVIGFGACVVFCANLTFQGGVFSGQFGGFGLLERGPYLGWANKPVDQRADWSGVFGGGMVVGGAASQGYPNGTLPGDRADWEVDVGPFTGIQYGEMYTFPIIDFPKLFRGDGGIL